MKDRRPDGSWRSALEREALRRAAPEIADACAIAGLDPDATPVAAIPYQNRPVLPTPPRSLARFCEALDRWIAAAFEEPPGPVPPDREEAPQRAALDAACALCQGACCYSGGAELAHLGKADMRRYRARHAGVTPQDLRAAYLEHLPENSALTGCVYQSREGCTLPRALRSQRCNTLICAGQKQIPLHGPAVLVALHGQRPAGVRVWAGQRDD